MEKRKFVKRVEGTPKISRSIAAGHTFKMAYGKKLTKEPAKTRCRVCNNGVLERRQWNILSCTNVECNHKELQ